MGKRSLLQVIEGNDFASDIILNHLIDGFRTDLFMGNQLLPYAFMS